MTERYSLFDRYGGKIGTVERQLTPFEEGKRIGTVASNTLTLLGLVAALLSESRLSELKLSAFAMSSSTVVVCYDRIFPAESYVTIFYRNNAPVYLPTGTRTIIAVAISKDGRWVVTGGTDGYLRLFDAERGIEVHSEHLSDLWYVGSVVFSTDASCLYLGVGNNDVRVWNVQDWRESRRFSPHTKAIMSLDISPDNKILAVGGGSGLITLIDTHSLLSVGELRGHSIPIIGKWSGVRHVAFSSDGSFLASTGSDSTVRIWGVAEGRQLCLLKGHHRGVWSASFSDNSTLLASGGDDGTVRLWDVRIGREIGILQKSVNPVRTVKFSGNSFIYTANENGTITELSLTL